MGESRDRLENPYDLVGAQHNRQLARRAGVGDPLRNLAVAKPDPREKSQGTDGLSERRPGIPFDTRCA